MKPKKDNPKITKVEGSSVNYEVSKIKFKGIDRATFNFDDEFKKGYTVEEAKAEMRKRINAYPWKK
ncbi:hypothetical protein FNW52_01300 [Flavobacterium sp. ZT3R18]|uniref:hypothetical protein n=1 Tax=Flavobacterium sp. ZT3R18 TaxID=2594429 RepID=UPI00117A6A39|nr:hypothetical protein [Flavobacterium sp. ZT3R18]TRX38709.1 hypothetical protein FNW52_01300 [Flavobacterium sp. ZT3R18]